LDGDFKHGEASEGTVSLKGRFGNVLVPSTMERTGWCGRITLARWEGGWPTARSILMPTYYVPAAGRGEVRSDPAASDSRSKVRWDCECRACPADHYSSLGGRPAERQRARPVALAAGHRAGTQTEFCRAPKVWQFQRWSKWPREGACFSGSPVDFTLAAGDADKTGGCVRYLPPPPTSAL